MGKHWKGHYVQGAREHPMECKVEWDDGKIEGKGKDGVGEFTWTGTYNSDGEVHMTKQYIGKHSVAYVGKLDEGHKTLVGTWTLAGGTTGTFTLKD